MKNKNDMLKLIKEAIGYKNLNLENFDEFVKYEGDHTYLINGDELCGGDFYLYKQNVNNKVEKNVTNSKDLFGYTTNLQKTI